MGDGWQNDAINFMKSIKDYYNRFIKNTYTIVKDPPIYVKEGNHRVLIEYQDKDSENKEDNVYEYDVNVSLLEDEKGLLGFFVSYDDDEKMELQDDKAQLEYLSAEREIAASYVHEIKKPLFSIRGFLQILQQSFSEDDKRKGYTDIMIIELDRMNTLLNEFLSRYRNQVPLDSMFCDGIPIKETLKEIIAFFQHSFDLKGITCNLDFCDDELLVSIDKDKLTQVFINIIQNSMEAMYDGGILSIKTYYQNDKVCIQIKDEGVGIKKTDMEKIFTPFLAPKKKGQAWDYTLSKES